MWRWNQPAAESVGQTKQGAIDTMKIQVLGTGCPKCKEVARNVEAAVCELGIDAEVERVTGINDILSFGVMMTPALAVDGDVKAVGKVPSVSDIKAMLA